MLLKDFFTQVGGNYNTVMERLPSEAMVKRFVCKFADDPSYNELKSALAKGDIATAFRFAHTIKGTAANLGLDTLANAASLLTEELRGASSLPDESYVEAVDSAYRLTMDAISRLDV